MNRMTDMTKNLSNFFSERGLVASQQLGPVEFLSQTIFLSYGLRKGKNSDARSRRLAFLVRTIRPLN